MLGVSLWKSYNFLGIQDLFSGPNTKTGSNSVPTLNTDPEKVAIALILSEGLWPFVKGLSARLLFDLLKTIGFY